MFTWWGVIAILSISFHQIISEKLFSFHRLSAILVSIVLYMCTVLTILLATTTDTIQS